MSKVSISGDQNGTGNFQIKAPNSNVDRTLTIPDSDGEFLTKDNSGNVGINTDSAAAPLEIEGTGNLLLLENTEDAGYKDTIIFNNKFNRDIGFTFQNQGVEKWIIFNDGPTETTGDNFSVFNPNGTGFFVSQAGNFHLDSGFGSMAVTYGCRAWVNFNGTNTTIRNSGNVSSISDFGIGQYRVNFSENMPDGDYSISSFSGDNKGTGTNYSISYLNLSDYSLPDSSGFVIQTQEEVGVRDAAIVTVAVFR